MGNILTVSKNGTLIESYEYDSLNQLTRENNSSAGYTKLYSYDPMGNITSKVEIPFTMAPTASLDTSNGTVTSYGYASGGLLPWGDMLVNYNGTAITYDNIGNPLNWRNATQFVWSARELVSASLSNGNAVSYTYNADGIRTQKVYNNTVHNYTLDGSKMIKEEVSVNGNTSYELYYIYDASGSVIGFHYNNAPYYFLKNLQGDIVSIVNAMGTVVVEYTYDAWGKLLTTTGTLASTIGAYNPFRYRGYYYDSETGLYYLQSRYYDPVVGRFLNSNSYASTGQGILGNNMFAYCNNNPVKKSVKSSDLNNSFAVTDLLNRGSFSPISVVAPEYVAEETVPDGLILYDVPLYDQDKYNLCWAFCQIMIEDYQKGIVSTNDQATDRAKQLAIEYHNADGIEDDDVWNKGGWPTNRGNCYVVDDINDIYELLVNGGPLYAYYCGKNLNNNKTIAHLIVVTGVDLTKGIVYTNNPWGVYGVQTFDEFSQGCANSPSHYHMTLYYCYTVK